MKKYFYFEILTLDQLHSCLDALPFSVRARIFAEHMASSMLSLMFYFSLFLIHCLSVSDVKLIIFILSIIY